MSFHQRLHFMPYVTVSCHIVTLPFPQSERFPRLLYSHRKYREKKNSLKPKFCAVRALRFVSHLVQGILGKRMLLVALARIQFPHHPTRGKLTSSRGKVGITWLIDYHPPLIIILQCVKTLVCFVFVCHFCLWSVHGQGLFSLASLT